MMTYFTQRLRLKVSDRAYIKIMVKTFLEYGRLTDVVLRGYSVR